MSDDRFLDEIRTRARALRYEPDDPALLSRLEARIRERITSAPPTVAEMLSRWIRPAAVTFAALALVAMITLAATPAEEDLSLAEAGAQITVAGDAYRVGN